ADGSGGRITWRLPEAPPDDGVRAGAFSGHDPAAGSRRVPPRRWAGESSAGRWRGRTPLPTRRGWRPRPPGRRDASDPASHSFRADTPSLSRLGSFRGGHLVERDRAVPAMHLGVGGDHRLPVGRVGDVDRQQVGAAGTVRLVEGAGLPHQGTRPVVDPAMLSQVLVPRRYKEYLAETVGMTYIAVEAPPVGPGREAHPPDPVHHLHELLVVPGVDRPGVHHHHRAALQAL